MARIKPIRFPSPIADVIIHALLDDRKTMIRLPMKPQPEPFGKAYLHRGAICSRNGLLNLASYRPGDILYVQEAFDKEPVTPDGSCNWDGVWYYRADGECRPVAWRGNWHPSVHMPKAAARIFLRVTGVSMEHLQDISDDDVLAEGTPDSGSAGANLGYFADNLWAGAIKSADCALYGWAANPWVEVIRFERISKELVVREGFCG